MRRAASGHRLVVHPDVAKVARVRAVMGFLIEVIARDRAALLGGALPAEPTVLQDWSAG